MAQVASWCGDGDGASFDEFVEAPTELAGVVVAGRKAGGESTSVVEDRVGGRAGRERGVGGAHDDGGVDGLAWPASVTMSPDGRYVYAGGWADNAVAVFSSGDAHVMPASIALAPDNLARLYGMTVQAVERSLAHLR